MGRRVILSRPYGRGGARPRSGWEVRVCTPDSEKTLTPQAFGLGPPSPAKSGRGVFYPFTFTTCRNRCLIATRSVWASITAPMSL